MAPPPPSTVAPPPTSTVGLPSYDSPPYSDDPPSDFAVPPPPAVVAPLPCTCAAASAADAPLFPAAGSPPSPESITICKT